LNSPHVIEFKDLAIHPKVMTLLIGLAITSAIGVAMWLVVQHEVTNGTNGTNANGTNDNGTNGTSTRREWYESYFI
jgi:hypothetical protein